MDDSVAEFENDLYKLILKYSKLDEAEIIKSLEIVKITFAYQSINRLTNGGHDGL